jgi:choline-glycine betaine transporter
LIAEAFAFRSWIFHAANGGVSGWIGCSIMQDSDEKYRFLTEPKVMVAAGLAGGLVYWLIAGWSAGFWKPVFGPEPAPPQAQVQA